MPNLCYYLAISFTNHLYLYSYIYSLAMHLRYSSAPLVYIYVCVDGTSLNARGGNFFLQKKHGFLGLTPVYSETTALSKPYFILKRRNVRKFLLKRLLFMKQNWTGYYGIEDPFPDLISKLSRFMGDTECRLLVIKSRW